MFAEQNSIARAIAGIRTFVGKRLMEATSKLQGKFPRESGRIVNNHTNLNNGPIPFCIFPTIPFYKFYRLQQAGVNYQLMPGITIVTIERQFCKYNDFTHCVNFAGSESTLRSGLGISHDPNQETPT